MYKFSDKILKCSSHKLLECRWCIAVTHLYHMALECSKYCGERGFMHIFRLNASLLISLSQFGPESSSCYIMTNSVLLREGCYVPPCIIVLLAQIKYSVQSAVFLRNTQH